MTKPRDTDKGFDSSVCSLDFTPEEQAELDEAMKTWIPFWRKPTNPQEWDKLVSQRYSFAISTKESHDDSVASDAPLFLRQLLAKSRYISARKYWRTKRRAATEKRRLCEKLLHAMGVKLAD